MKEKLTYTSTTPQPGTQCGHDDCDNDATELFRGELLGSKWDMASTCGEHANLLLSVLLDTREAYERRLTPQVRRPRSIVGMPGEVTYYDGHAFTSEIVEPGWLRVWTTTNLENGRSWRSVYRSPELRDTDDEYRAVLELIGDAEPLKSEVVEDESMFFGRAELSVYSMPEAARL